MNYIQTHALQDMVQYKGWIKSEEKQSLLSVCDVYILPSYFEGLPMSILEAMMHGKSIVSTCVGVPEVVIPNYNG